MIDSDKKKIIVVDNFFKYPHLVRIKGLTKKYYDKHNHPDLSAINSFPGIRSLDLSLIDKKLNNFTKNKIKNILTNKGIYGCINPHENQFRLNYSLTFDDTNYTYHYDMDCHPSIINYAGIIYLHPNPVLSHGTSMVFSDEKIEIENVFNRMVIYPTSVYHSLSGSFGTNIFNARMVLSIFFNLIQ